MRLQPQSEEWVCSIVRALLTSEKPYLGVNGGPRECAPLPTPVLVRLDGSWAEWARGEACTGPDFRAVNYEEPRVMVLEVALKRWRTDEVEYYVTAYNLEANKECEPKGCKVVVGCCIAVGVARRAGSGWTVEPRPWPD